MGFYEAFLMTEKQYEAELETSFTDCVIWWIRTLEKSRVGELPSHLASTGDLYGSGFAEDLLGDLPKTLP